MRLLALLLVAGPAAAQLSERDLATAVARPPADARLPAGLTFRDTDDRGTTLGAVQSGKPLALVFADYTCRHVCSPGLALTAAALRDTRLAAGRDYRLAVIGMDPRDTAADARHLGEALAAVPAVARATTLLTGDAANVGAATRALGYRTVYDPAHDQFAHDAVVYVFGADGRLAALLPELGLQPAALRAALTERPVPEGLAARVAHLCYGFAAAQGRFGRPIVVALQAASLALLGAAAWWLLKRRRAAA